MGAFNELTADFACSACGHRGRMNVQFKYGDTYQSRYSLGDKLRWGGNDVGVPSKKKVLVAGLAGPCPSCGVDGFDVGIVLEADILAGLEVPASPALLESPSGFLIVE